MTESRASNAALEESKISRPQFIAGIDDKILFKSEEGASAAGVDRSFGRIAGGMSQQSPIKEAST